MNHVQEMTKLQQFVEPDWTISFMTPVFSPKLATVETCAVPSCESSLLGRSKKRSPSVAKDKHVTDKEGILARDIYEVGYFVSTNKFVVHTPGRIPTGYGCKCSHNSFHGGNIYNDAASSFICPE